MIHLCGSIAPDAMDFAAELVGQPVPYSATEATVAAALFNQSGRRRGSLMDYMIAATAIESDAALATTNVRNFRRLKSLGLHLAELDQ